jgi:hypothetical protein
LTPCECLNALQCWYKFLFLLLLQIRPFLRYHIVSFVMENTLAEGDGEVAGTSVVLDVGSAGVLAGDLAGVDRVAVGDVAARVEGVPDGKVEATLLGLGDGPRVGDVVAARAVLDLGEVVRALEEGTAVRGGQDGVADDLEGVAGGDALACARPSRFQGVLLPALGAVGDAVTSEIVNLVGGDLLLLQCGGRGSGGNGEDSGELHFVGY